MESTAKATLARVASVPVPAPSVSSPVESPANTGTPMCISTLNMVSKRKTRPDGRDVGGTASWIDVLLGSS